MTQDRVENLIDLVDGLLWKVLDKSCLLNRKLTDVGLSLFSKCHKSSSSRTLFLTAGSSSVISFLESSDTTSTSCCPRLPLFEGDLVSCPCGHLDLHARHLVLAFVPIAELLLYEYL